MSYTTDTYYPKDKWVDHCPDGYVIIRFPNDDYRVFGGYYGGYLGSDTWRLNSGCASAKLDDKGWFVYGNSGSIYFVGTENYGNLPSYCTSVADEYCEKNGGVVLTQDEAFDFLNELVLKSGNGG